MTISIGMITFDTEDPRRLVDFWTKALNTSVAQDYGDFVMLAPATEGGVSLAFQRVGDPTPGKNRVHFDAHVTDLEAEVERLVGLGATAVERHTHPGLTWQVLADPDGNRFCLAHSG
ncbi:VOC family protein [Saccharothrix syringae]|uniref:Glyoxalase/bleomycin resistance/dioxygenase family protein n=1 Tax=Saccharothrix syringae TaxID=103733 RepID=A0A5Q0H9P4_SACSY|nr:VOC family protein [Saccharothrix syringae]QFZ22663.1 glyoxalase/bleomycin resistance/dioxygenase family protein [Saccharothrix syringae]